MPPSVTSYKLVPVMSTLMRPYFPFMSFTLSNECTPSIVQLAPASRLAPTFVSTMVAFW